MLIWAYTRLKSVGLSTGVQELQKPNSVHEGFYEAFFLNTYGVKH